MMEPVKGDDHEPDPSRPSGLPPAESSARRRTPDPEEEIEKSKSRSLEAPATDAAGTEDAAKSGPAAKAKKRAAKNARNEKRATSARERDEADSTATESATGGTAADSAAHDTAAHDTAAHDTAANDTAAHDTAAHDGAATDGAATDRAATEADGDASERMDAERADAAAEAGESDDDDAIRRPTGLKHMTTSARLRLQLAFDDDEEEEGPKRPRGLTHMSTSARRRLELALEQEEDASIPPPVIDKTHLASGQLPLDERARATMRSLGRWVMFCGLMTMTLGALTGLSYLTGPGSIAHVVVGILACAVSVWLLAAAWSFRQVLADRPEPHHLVTALGHIRSALLLKAVLVFAAMVLGCFGFSIAGSLLFLLG
ncbi:MAG: hypothetical protein AB7S26_20220 [Sandaracinaceae bacterium]